MARRLLLVVLGIAGGMAFSSNAHAGEYEPKPDNSYFVKFNPALAPAPGPLLLRTNDRLAIIGDSITEQKRYSRIMETYLTVCVPQFKISTRQFGWSGETAEGFLHRMTNDCLRFNPTVATLCYGMNDFRYRPFDLVNSEWYRANYSAVVHNLESAGARVVVGSAGCVSRVPPWVKTPSFTMDELNNSLCAFRDIDIEIAREANARFADIFWTMFKAGFDARGKFGEAGKTYMISGARDGVHPDWAGHLVMAYVFLRSLGLDGDIGTITVDLSDHKAAATSGHEIASFDGNRLTVVSQRYPFCSDGATDSDNSIRSGTELVPFYQDLSRFQLVVKNASSQYYRVIWGETTNIYSAVQLSAGVNLAKDYVANPFCDAFKKVDEAVAAKQAFETHQIKEVFHGAEGKADMDKAVQETEAKRAKLVANIEAAAVPVRHTIVIEPVQWSSWWSSPGATSSVQHATADEPGK